MFEIKLPVVALIFLSLVNSLWAQYENTCKFQGKQVTGDFTMPGFCLLYRCIPGQGVTTIGCGIRVPPEGCYIDHPATDNYPECCYTNLICPETNRTLSGYEDNEVQAIPVSSEDSSTGKPPSNLIPPSGSTITPIFSPTPQNGNPPIDGFGQPQNGYSTPKTKTVGGGPYYYKK